MSNHARRWIWILGMVLLPAAPGRTAPAERQGAERAPSPATTPVYHLSWCSIHGGGGLHAQSTHFNAGLSVGQAAVGLATSPGYRMGYGFWYGVRGAGSGGCGVALTGDVNLTGAVSSADIIYQVNFVFKGQAPPLPCEASGDVNCSGSVTSADIIYMVNYVFKGQAAPCDICTLIPAVWTCP